MDTDDASDCDGQGERNPEGGAELGGEIGHEDVGVEHFCEKVTVEVDTIVSTKDNIIMDLNNHDFVISYKSKHAKEEEETKGRNPTD